MDGYVTNLLPDAQRRNNAEPTAQVGGVAASATTDRDKLVGLPGDGGGRDDTEAHHGINYMTRGRLHAAYADTSGWHCDVARLSSVTSAVNCDTGSSGITICGPFLVEVIRTTTVHSSVSAVDGFERETAAIHSTVVPLAVRLLYPLLLLLLQLLQQRPVANCFIQPTPARRTSSIYLRSYAANLTRLHASMNGAPPRYEVRRIQIYVLLYIADTMSRTTRENQVTARPRYNIPAIIINRIHGSCTASPICYRPNCCHVYEKSRSSSTVKSSNYYFNTAFNQSTYRVCICTDDHFTARTSNLRLSHATNV